VFHLRRFLSPFVEFLRHTVATDLVQLVEGNQCYVLLCLADTRRVELTVQTLAGDLDES